MTATIAIVGLLFLLAVAAAIGLADSGSQRSAWRRIAAARREIFEDRRVIDELTVALQVREDEVRRLENAVRQREKGVAERERRLPPDGQPAA